METWAQARCAGTVIFMILGFILSLRFLPSHPLSFTFWFRSFFYFRGDVCMCVLRGLPEDPDRWGIMEALMQRAHLGCKHGGTVYK
jgi:hypothetical protein